MTRPRSKPDAPRILLVRLRLIGDVAFTTPILRALRRRFPDAHIAYVVEPSAAPVIAGNPHVNELLVIPKRSGIARLRDDFAMAQRLRRGRFDIALDLHGGPRAGFLTWASRAPMRIGYSIAGRSWMYTHVVGRSPDLAPRHSVLNQADLLGPLGIDGCDPVREPMEMAPDATVRARVLGQLSAAGVGPDDPVVAIHVSAGNPFRRWPPESFAALAAALTQQHPQLRVVLFSGPSDHAAAAAIAEKARTMSGAAGTRILEGSYDPQELRELAARSAVYIGGDSGPLHIAATTETPIVALLGPTLPERSRPWRDPRWFTEMIDAGSLPCRPCEQRQCAPGDFRCLTGITAEQVVAAALRALHARSATTDAPAMTGTRA